jgi:hypothetical protein
VILGALFRFFAKKVRPGEKVPKMIEITLYIVTFCARAQNETPNSQKIGISENFRNFL